MKIAAILQHERPLGVDESERVTIFDHEVGNILTVINAHAELLCGYDDPIVQEHGQNITRAAAHLRHLMGYVTELHDVDHLLIVHDVDMRSWLQDLLSTIAPTLGPRKLLTSFPLPDSQLICEVDPKRLSQVVINLFANIARYTDPTTEVWVHLYGSQSHALITVSDNGPGIGEAEWEACFELYGRLSPDSVPGRGIGLFVAQAIARAHGGDLQLLRSNQGASFLLSVPRS